MPMILLWFGRPLDTPEEDGCLLEPVDGNPIFDMRKSVSIPINVIDSGKCLAVDDSEWNNQLEKQHHKSPSSIEILSATECRELGIDVSLPDEAEVYAGHASPKEIVAVVRPALFKSRTASKHLDQKYVMKDCFEMSLVITFSAYENFKDERNLYSGCVTPSSRGGFHGLYVFRPKCDSHPLFHRTGIYKFMFSIMVPSCQKYSMEVRVKASLLPGSVKRVAIQPENFEKQLIPGHVIKELILELFDTHGNHLQEDEELRLSVDGFCFTDGPNSIQKVDGFGCIHLGGLLRVTADYGQIVSLSIWSKGKVVITKDWQIEKRQRRTASMMPKSCIAGSQPEKMEFYDDDKMMQSHTRVLKSQFSLESELLGFGLKIREHEDNIKLLQHQQKATESDILEFQLARDQVLRFGTNGSHGKKEIRERVERKTESAAAVIIKLFREALHHDYCGLMGHVIGVVALLGTVPTLELSRLFAEYLGDQMLAVVCKSYEDVRLLETYERSGKLNCSLGLRMFAEELGQSINGRYLVLCIEDIRACEADKDLEGKLVLHDPVLPNGATPSGFLGYAVNMINIDVDHLDASYDLRKTLFYRLFGETQVYESRDDMKNAFSCIKDGAVSLDGGIFRGNGAVSLGCSEPDIIFPIVAAGDQVLSKHARRAMERYREKKLKLKEITTWLIDEKKSHKKALEKFKKRFDTYDKYFTDEENQI